jgi:PPOX class probable F420-dependent enzyme
MVCLEDHVALDETVRTFLNERRFASLATINRDGSPHLSTMWYLLDGDTIVMNTRRGRVKDRNMVADPRVSICIEDGYRYVTISGRVELNSDQSVAQPDIYALAVRYEGKESADRQVAEAFGSQERVTMRLPIENIDAHGF